MGKGGACKGNDMTKGKGDGVGGLYCLMFVPMKTDCISVIALTVLA